MKISEILEARLNNTGHSVDILRGVSDEAKEIRQSYNVCLSKKLYGSRKRVMLTWATYAKHDTVIQQNPELIAMLDEIIRICSS